MNIIVYGLGNKYCPKKFKPIRNRRDFSIKPSGGLWGSPVGSKWGWKEWCETEQWGDLSSSFTIKFSGRAFVIDGLEDARRLPWRNGRYRPYIDFELLAQEYDAVHLTIKGQRETRFSRECSLYGWDCETVLVLNPKSIAPIIRE